MERKHKSQPTVNKEIKPEVDREDFDMKISRPAPSPPAISMNLTRVINESIDEKRKDLGAGWRIAVQNSHGYFYE
ncbi:hypothetical protein GCK72_011700 [Caenorhabditis remanei]|uniref:Uncharacterized protein n=1 Tax=Caenorhabditis remanei TaxID=31234 RepID=A0A6A5H9E6_CAERE|nr:hypothetical protein GCK72_011700 [Caenorhabditis remanei]KAF1763434.1 hypothetical protein GCK72_011700 [Caenorhabditis remanei]